MLLEVVAMLRHLLRHTRRHSRILSPNTPGLAVSLSQQQLSQDAQPQHSSPKKCSRTCSQEASLLILLLKVVVIVNPQRRTSATTGRTRCGFAVTPISHPAWLSNPPQCLVTTSVV